MQFLNNFKNLENTTHEISFSKQKQQAQIINFDLQRISILVSNIKQYFNKKYEVDFSGLI